MYRYVWTGKPRRAFEVRLAPSGGVERFVGYVWYYAGKWYADENMSGVRVPFNVAGPYKVAGVYGDGRDEVAAMLVGEARRTPATKAA